MIDYARICFVIMPFEPTWMMIILGFAGIGFMAYRRSRKGDGIVLAA